MALRLDQRDAGFARAFDNLVNRRRDAAEDVGEAVAAILDDVRRRGDEALIDHTRRFDGMTTDARGLRIDRAEIEAATAACVQDDLEALDFAAERIRAFHARQMPRDDLYTDALGIRLGVRWQPIEAVGLYVPGGTAAYPSSVLMNAIPAKVAGCARLVMTVPTPKGVVAPLVLAAAARAGVDEVWRLGGAQAIGALACGTASLRPVDKVVGPGNAYVAEAKRQVFGRIGIDMIAGPSEIVVVADRTAVPDWVAADLLSQAEHDVRAQSILITDDAALAEAVERAVERQLQGLERVEIARESWAREGAVLLLETLDDAPALIDALAPEHLELMVADPDGLAAAVRRAGAIFLGHHTPEVIGDYVGGPNHVLPTSRSARFSSGLSVYDFLTRTTLLGCDAASFAALAPGALTLARAEGLHAHAAAVAVRGSDAA